jgi:hypothetical protein
VGFCFLADQYEAPIKKSGKYLQTPDIQIGGFPNNITQWREEQVQPASCSFYFQHLVV